MKKIFIFGLIVLAIFLFKTGAYKEISDSATSSSLKDEYENRLKIEAQEKKEFDDWQKVTDRARDTGVYVDCGGGRYFVFQQPNVWLYKVEDGRLLFGTTYTRTDQRVNWTQWPGIQYELHLDSMDLYYGFDPIKCTRTKN